MLSRRAMSALSAACDHSETRLLIECHSGSHQKPLQYKYSNVPLLNANKK